MAYPPFTEATLYPATATVSGNVKEIDNAAPALNTATSIAHQVNTTRSAVQKTFIPLAAQPNGTNSDAFTNQSAGWLIPEADFKPADTRGRAFVGGSTIQFDIAVKCKHSNALVLSGTNLTPKVALWARNFSTGAVTLISSATGAVVALPTGTPSTTDGAETNCPVTMTVADPTIFERADGFYIQMGGLLDPAPAVAVGNNLATVTLQLKSTTVITLANGLRSFYQESGSSSGVGVVTLQAFTIGKVVSVVGAGVAAISKFIDAFRQFTVSGVGVAGINRSVMPTPIVVSGAGVADVRKYVRIAAPFAVIGVAMASVQNYTRLAAKVVTALGVVDKRLYIRLAAKSVTGVGVAVFARALIAARAFAVVGAGIASLYLKVSQAIVNRLEGGAQIVRKTLNIFDDSP